MMQEEFEKWANGFDHDSRDWLDMGNDKVFFAGWQARQAEIDAWMEDSIRLAGIIDNWKERCDMRGMEIQELKAENERLRLALKDGGDASLLGDVHRLCSVICNSSPERQIKGKIESMAFSIAHHPRILAVMREG